MNRKLLIALAAVATLAGCHRNDNSASPPQSDAFTSTVSATVSGPESSSEVAEPVSVQNTTPSNSETAEPQKVN